MQAYFGWAKPCSCSYCCSRHLSFYDSDSPHFLLSSVSTWRFLEEKHLRARRKRLHCRLDSYLRRHESYPVHEQQQHRTWTSRSHTSNIVPKWLAERVWYTKSRFYFWIFTSVLVGSSPRSFTYISSTATKLGGSKWMFVLPLSS